MLGQTKFKLWRTSPSRQYLRFSKCVETRVATIVPELGPGDNPGVTVVAALLREGHLALIDPTVAPCPNPVTGPPAAPSLPLIPPFQN